MQSALCAIARPSVGSRALSFKQPLLSLAWMSVAMYVCMSTILRSNILETKGDRESITIGSLCKSGQGQSNGDVM